jgi:hypothetical protein
MPVISFIRRSGDIHLPTDDIDKYRFGWLINDANATCLCDFIDERRSRDRLEMHKLYNKVEAKVFRTHLSLAVTRHWVVLQDEKHKESATQLIYTSYALCEQE